MPFAARGGFLYAYGDEPAPSGAWDITTAQFVASKSTSPETQPSGVFFKPDGTVMYTVGQFQDNVTQWSLSTPWDILSATISKTYSILNEDTGALDVYFRPDGTRMYIVGNATNAVYQYTLSTPWDIGNVTYNTGLSVVSQDGTPSGMAFDDTGTKLYVSGAIGDSIYQYSLSTAWLVSSGTFLQSYNVGAQETSPEGIFFKPDGTYFYLIGSGTDLIYEYSVGTPWNITTLSYTNKSFSVASVDNAPRGLFIGNDGFKMYVVGDALNTITEYTLGT